MASFFEMLLPLLLTEKSLEMSYWSSQESPSRKCERAVAVTGCECVAVGNDVSRRGHCCKSLPGNELRRFFF
jgi:hypothetical protein